MIGTCDDASMLSAAFRRRFTAEVPIPMLSASIRQLMLSVMLASVLDEDTKDDLLAEIIRSTSGFVARDIMRFCRLCIANAESCSRSSLQRSDITAALASTAPMQFRVAHSELSTTTWEYVGGYDYVKQSLLEVVEWPLKHVTAFDRLSVHTTSGVLLYGPSGCGKTLMIRALAGTSAISVISVRGYIGCTDGY